MTFFRDIVASLTTFCSPYLRHMGYLNEAIAMRGRSLERRGSWQPHLDRTRTFVLAAASSCTRRNRATVLGSGLLLDLPLPELSSLFREIVLLDVVCLPDARREIRKYGNVTFVEHDVTGIAERLYLNRHRGIRELPEPEDIRLPGQPSDFVVSLNILSQLWVIPRAFAMGEFPGIDPDRVDEWCSAIVRAHDRLLRDMTCPVCVVADYAFVNRDAAGSVYGRGSTIGNFVLPDPDDTWTWLIDPGGKSRVPSGSRELLVAAWKRYGQHSTDFGRNSP